MFSTGTATCLTTMVGIKQEFASCKTLLLQEILRFVLGERHCGNRTAMMSRIIWPPSFWGLLTDRHHCYRSDDIPNSEGA